MIIPDNAGIISSVVYGPDQRTLIMSETQNVLFTTHAPMEISKDEVCEHLHHIKSNVLLVSPQAEVELLDVYVTTM